MSFVAFNSDVLAETTWWPVTNAYGGTVPAYSLVRVTGVASDGSLQIDRPNADGQNVLITGPGDIASSGRGTATYETPWQAVYDTGDGTPAAGEIWGAGASSFKLRKNNPGFIICGGASDGYCVVRRSTDSSHSGESITYTNQTITYNSSTITYASSSTVSFSSVTVNFTSTTVNINSGTWTWYNTNTYQNTYAGTYISGSTVTFNSGSTVTFNNTVVYGATAIITFNATSVVTFNCFVTFASYVIISNVAVTINTNQNNYDITVYQELLVNCTGNFTFTGFAGGTQGRFLILLNLQTSTNTITLAHNSGSSSVGNKILCPGGSNYSIAPGYGVMLYYGAASSWNAIPMASETGTTDFADNTFFVHDDGDSSKKLAFQCSGISASTTRTITLQDASGTMYITGGTDVTLGDGGTGYSLSDPNADRIFFWDDSAGHTDWLSPGTNMSITGTSFDAAGTGVSNVATEYTGTTTDAYATVFDTTNNPGIHGSVRIKNTHGTNTLSYKCTVTDMYGNSGNSGDVSVFAGTYAAVANTGSTVGIGSVVPPWKTVKLEVKSTSAGNAATYDIWRSFVT